MELLWVNKQGSSSASESSPIREVSSVDGVIEDMQSRIRRLERWHTINTVLPTPFYSKSCTRAAYLSVWILQVLWTFLMSALVGYSLYQRKPQWCCRLVFTLRAEFFLNLVAVLYHFYGAEFFTISDIPPVLINYCTYTVWSCFLIWSLD